MFNNIIDYIAYDTGKPFLLTFEANEVHNDAGHSEALVFWVNSETTRQSTSIYFLTDMNNPIYYY